MQQQEPRRSVAARLFQVVVSFILVPTMWLMFLVAGWLAIKSSLPNATLASAPGTATTGPASAGSMFAPKEYNKARLLGRQMSLYAQIFPQSM